MRGTLLLDKDRTLKNLDEETRSANYIWTMAHHFHGFVVRQKSDWNLYFVYASQVGLDEYMVMAAADNHQTLLPKWITVA